MTRSEICEIHCQCGRMADFRLRLATEGLDGVARQKALFRKAHPEGEYTHHLQHPVKHRILSWDEVLEAAK